MNFFKFKMSTVIAVPISANEQTRQYTVSREYMARRKEQQNHIQNKLNMLIVVAGALFCALLWLPKASAEIVTLNGVITDGEFLSPSFVADPNAPGGGSIQLVDQLGLTDSPFTLIFEVNSDILDDPLSEGFSFLIEDPAGNVTGSNLSISGTLGDPGMDGFVFESILRSAGQRIAFENGSLAIDVFVEGSNEGARFLGASFTNLLSLMTATVPDSVQNVGDLVEFLQTTQAFTSGTFPVDFFVGVGDGSQMMAASDISFDVSAQAEVPSVPLPGAIWLFISGLIGLRMMKRKVISTS